MFNGVAVICTKEQDTWINKEVVITSVNDIKSCVDENLGEVRLDKYRRIFYSVNENGINAKAKDCYGDMHYMSSPIMLVECDDSEPIKISQRVLNSIKETIDFY